MTNKDLISQYVDTGIKIGKYQFDKLSSSDKKTYIRKRINIQDNEYNLDYYELEMMDISNRMEYADNLNSYDIDELIQNSEDPNRLIRVMGDKCIQRVIQMDVSSLSDLIRNSKEPFKIVEFLISVDGYIDEAGIYDISYLIRNSGRPYEVIKLLNLKNSDLVDKLISNPREINILIMNCKNRDALLEYLITREDYIKNLDYEGKMNLLTFYKDRDKLEAILNKYGK